MEPTGSLLAQTQPQDSLHNVLEAKSLHQMQWPTASAAVTAVIVQLMRLYGLLFATTAFQTK